MYRLWLGLRALLFPDRVERELEEEMQFHVDMLEEQLARRGLTGAAARDAARRSFGPRARHKEQARDARYLAGVEEILRDLTCAVRGMRSRPGFSAIIILVLATGIGVNTAIFSALNSVLLETPPYRDADRLAFIWRTDETGAERLQVPAPDVTDYRNRKEVFDGVAFAANPSDGMMSLGDDAEHARVGVVSSDLFEVLGVPAAIGRTFHPEEGEIQAAFLADSTFEAPPSVVVLSHELWLTRFGADPAVVGRTVTVNGQVLTVVGVLPRSFSLRTPPDVGYARNVDLWTPLRVDLGQFQRENRRSDLDSDNTGIVIARLAPGADLSEAQAALDVVAARQREMIPAYREAAVGIRVVPLVDDLVAHAKPALLALQGAVGLVLLIACMNVAMMLAARGSSRWREIAVRTALGAGRWRLVKQLLTETLLLATVAGVLGIGFAVAATPAVADLSALALPDGAAMRVDATALAFTVLVSLVAAVLAGMLPAVLHTGQPFTNALRDRSSTGDPTATRIGRSLVIAQIALSVMLLAGAGLLLKSLRELQRVDPGFDPDQLVVFSVNLTGGGLRGPADRALFVRDLEQRIRALPGVQAVGLTNAMPLSGTEWTQPYGFEGVPEVEWERNRADFRMVTSEYFPAMRIAVVAGRTFTPEEDVYERERVVVVDRTLARRIDPSGDALGHRIGIPLDGAPITAEIVGVVDRVRHSSLDVDGRETIYVPYRQEASRSMAVAVRTSGTAASLTSDLRRELRAIDNGVPVFGFTLMDERVSEILAPNRFVLALVAVFAGVALALAASGLYGLLSYTVNQRTREIGVRLAFGAGQRRVVGFVLGRGLILVALGLAAGIPGSILTSRALAGLLYTVTPTDHVTLLTVTGVLGVLAALACYIPARRASRVDPMVALRVE